MSEKTNEITSKINQWNARCSQSHDVYLGEIAQIAFGEEYDCTMEKNDLSDFGKLSKIWQLVNHDHDYSDAELMEKVKETILM